jgi:uncharacterized protein YfdQ (DUF2303 family)
MDIEKGVVEEIRDLARAAAVAKTEEKIHYVVVPHGSTITSLREYQYPFGIPPERIVASPKFQDQASFCSYINSYKDHRTRLFADSTACSFLALIDYHGAGAEMKPEFVSHKASLTLTFSDEWRLWFANNEKLIPQIEFAEFLEDNRQDIQQPDSATLLEIAKDLQAATDVNFESKVNTSNGAATLQYQQTIKATVSTGRIEMPETFWIRIPVFFGEADEDIPARLRFRIADGKLKFQYKLYRPAEIRQKAFDVTRDEIAKSTAIEVLLGTL